LIRIHPKTGGGNMEIEKTDSHIPSASATVKLIPNQNTKGAFPSTITPHPSGSSFDWKRLMAILFGRTDGIFSETLFPRLLLLVVKSSYDKF
ncbi:MAG: hypothetical protein ACYCOR_15915, partial [Acidobacteriaceae bacterium]